MEPSIAKLAKEYMEEDGIVFEQGVKTSEVKNDGDEVVVVTDKGDFRFDALLYATGRKPNIEPLHLENTDIASVSYTHLSSFKNFQPFYYSTI